MELFCPACAQKVPTEVDPAHPERRLCGKCGLLLQQAGAAVLGRLGIKRVRADDIVDGPVVQGSVYVEEEPVLTGVVDPYFLVSEALPDPVRPPTRPTNVGKPFPRVLLADDMLMHQAVARDALLQIGLADEVVLVGRGDDFLAEFMRLYLAKKLPDLALLDVEMPGLSGVHAAAALRGIERGLGLAPRPILFFTARPCDEPFRRVMETLGRAAHLNKEGGGVGLDERLAQVLSVLYRPSAA
jgi:CheY-like chemotaxis protein